jgi:hypothetical protein
MTRCYEFDLPSRTRISFPSAPQMLTSPDTSLPTPCSQFCSHGIRFERICVDVGGRSEASDQVIWTTLDAVGWSGPIPKVPGSRPGRPTNHVFYRG